MKAAVLPKYSAFILINLWNHRGYNKPSVVTLYVSEYKKKSRIVPVLKTILSKSKQVWAGLSNPE